MDAEEKLLRGTWQCATAEQIKETLYSMTSRRVRFGYDTCVWHEITLHYRRNDDRPKCYICGSKTTKRWGGRPHELCRVRQDRGLPTPPLNDTIECPCMRCRRQ